MTPPGATSILQVPPASPALRPFVERLWYFTGDFAHARERILPTGRMQLLVNLHEDELRTYDGHDLARVQRIRGAALSGPYQRAFGIDTREQRHVVGVSFHPGGAAPFFAAPADALRNDHVELERLWGRQGALLRERLLEAPSREAALAVLEAVLLEQVVRPLEVDKLVDFALAALGRGVPVAHITEHLAVTPRRFIARFQGVVGLTPKRFARVQRFGRVLEAVGAGREVRWSEVAQACGYFDQAHLIHDFREFAGMSPTRYRPRSDGGNHAIVGE